MKCQVLFSRKIKKKNFKMLFAEIFTQHAKFLCLVGPVWHCDHFIGEEELTALFVLV